MKPNTIVINVRVPRSAAVQQVLRDNAPLPEGCIRWSFLGLVDFTNNTTTMYVGFVVDGQLIPIDSALALAAGSLLGTPAFMDVPSDYIPAGWLTGGVLADSLQFIAIGELINAVPGELGY